MSTATAIPALPITATVFLGAVEVDVGDDDVRAGFGKRDGHGAPDTRPGAGDENDSIFELVTALLHLIVNCLGAKSTI